MTKIEALEKTVYNLKNDVYEYRWASCNMCNCGVLARTILGGETASHAGLFWNGSGEGFAGIVRDTFNKCLQTGIPLPKVFQALHDAGFTHEELRGLERLSDYRIVAEAGYLSRYKKDDVIKYLKEWVSILKEEAEAVPQAQEIKEKIRYVSVPTSITKQTKELIYS